MRRGWNRPELTVIVWGMPEEAVLDVCKPYPVLGPESGFQDCRLTPGESGLCPYSCDTAVVS